MEINGTSFIIKNIQKETWILFNTDKYQMNLIIIDPRYNIYVLDVTS